MGKRMRNLMILLVAAGLVAMTENFNVLLGYTNKTLFASAVTFVYFASWIILIVAGASSRKVFAIAAVYWAIVVIDAVTSMLVINFGSFEFLKIFFMLIAYFPLRGITAILPFSEYITRTCVACAVLIFVGVIALLERRRKARAKSERRENA